MQIHSAADAKAFILGGNAVFTLVSLVTGNRKTFRVRKSDSDVHFVEILTGPDNTSDYTYIGYFRNDLQMQPGRKGAPAHPAYAALDWMLMNLRIGRMPVTAEFWHEGRCARCARPLTNPESIITGFGPECAKKKEHA